MTEVAIRRRVMKSNRLLWLATHRDYLDLAPITLFALMEQDGLYAHGTKWSDANLPGLIKEARELMAEARRRLENPHE